jgi:hypothetical protein
MRANILHACNLQSPVNYRVGDLFGSPNDLDFAPIVNADGSQRLISEYRRKT